MLIKVFIRINIYNPPPSLSSAQLILLNVKETADYPFDLPASPMTLELVKFLARSQRDFRVEIAKPDIKEVRCHGGCPVRSFFGKGIEVFQMRTSALFGVKNCEFFEI